MENFRLIRDSKHTKKYEKYWVEKKENKLSFSKKPNGYVLFILQLTDDPDPSVILYGLDGYGIRDNFFRKEICRLVEWLKKK